MLLDERVSDLIIEKVASGVLHIGAHHGQEAEKYNTYGKSVIWIEGKPSTFKILESNISIYPQQSAILALLGSIDSKQVNFFLTDNDNMSASIYRGKKNHQFNFKNIGVEQLKVRRLDSIFEDADIRGFDYWILDVQGAELDVLRGAGRLIRHAKYLHVEVSTFEIYENQTLFDELERFCESMDLFPVSRPVGKFHGNILFLRHDINLLA